MMLSCAILNRTNPRGSFASISRDPKGLGFGHTAEDVEMLPIASG